MKKRFQQPSLYPGSRAHRLWTPQTVQLIKLELCLFQYLPYLISPSLALPQFGTYLLCSLPAPHRKSRDALPAAHSVIIATRGTVFTPKRSRLGVNPALNRVRRTHPHWHWRLGPAQNLKGRNLPVPLPVQSRPLLILTMVHWVKPWGVLGIRTVRAVPTTVGPHLRQMCPERTWLILIWSQPLGIVSLAQTEMR